MLRIILATLTLATFISLAGCSEDSPVKPVEATSANNAKTAAASDPATAKAENALARWQPAFDPSGAAHTYLLSCIGHPDIEGVAVGFNIRDQVWERSNGRLFVDYRPLAQLGGEKDVLRKLQMGAVQGMLSSSVAAANLDDRLGLVNLPFLVDTPAKLEVLRSDASLFEAFGAPLKEKGILVADFTSYGGYGWASKQPVRTIEEARAVNFRIAEAPVNMSLYKHWGMKFTVMPWPDVPQALQTGVIDGLDHTPIVCSISRKFDNVGNFTFLNYAQGLYVHLINLDWLNSLPVDLKDLLLEVVAEQSALARRAAETQEATEIAKAKARGVTFHELSSADRAQLESLAAPIYAEWSPKIGEEFLNEVKGRMATQ